MRISLIGRHWHWSWQVNHWRSLLVLLSLAALFGHLLVSQTSVVSPSPEMAEDVPRRAKQGDRGLKMLVTTSAGGSTPQADAVSSASSTEGHADTLASPRETSPISARRPAGKGEADRDDAGSTARPAWTRLEARYRMRNERLRRVCQLRNVASEPLVYAMHRNETKKDFASQGIRLPESLTAETPITSHYSMASSLQTMACFLNKVASSSLVSAFLQTYGLGPSFKSPHSLAFKLMPRSTEDFQLANRTYFKFMFVRHPMDRMLSCYMDKMVESSHNSLPPFRSYVKSRARSIIANRLRLVQPSGNASTRRTVRTAGGRSARDASVLRRKRRISNEDETHRFIGRKLNADDANDGTQPSVAKSAFEKDNVTRAGEIPTFEEFLEFVLDTDLQGFGYDAHWVPFHRYCSPCSVPYHVIGKLETGAEDFQYVWRKTGLDSVSEIPWYNKAIGPSKKKIALEKKYYASLPRELILRFYSKFRMDFELFDYSINEILKKAGYDPIHEDNAL